MCRVLDLVQVAFCCSAQNKYKSYVDKNVAIYESAKWVGAGGFPCIASSEFIIINMVLDIVLKGKKGPNFVQLVSHGGTSHFNQKNLLGNWKKIEDVFSYVLLMWDATYDNCV